MDQKRNYQNYVSNFDFAMLHSHFQFQNLDYFHQNFGKKLVAKDSGAAYCGIFESGPTIRVMVFAGIDSGVNSGEIAREVASILGGSGGGDAKFAQGGGKDTSKKDQAIAKAKSMILG